MKASYNALVSSVTHIRASVRINDVICKLNFNHHDQTLITKLKIMIHDFIHNMKKPIPDNFLLNCTASTKHKQ